MLIALLLSFALFAFDMLQILGTACGFQVLFGVPLWMGVLFTFVSIGLIYMTEKYRDSSGIEIIFVSLMFVMAFCFFIDLGFSEPDWLDILAGTVIPHIPESNAGKLGILSLFGATILPHSLFMQSGMVK
jgi:natural resistance-associated macrophage protein 2